MGTHLAVFMNASVVHSVRRKWMLLPEQAGSYLSYLA